MKINKFDTIATVSILLVMLCIIGIEFVMATMSTMACDSNCSGVQEAWVFSYLALIAFVGLGSIIWSTIIATKRIKSGKIAFWAPLVGILFSVCATALIILIFTAVILPNLS